MLSWVALAYSLKFLWAPIVDRYDVPLLARLLGRRRGWMVLAQLATAVGPGGHRASANRHQPRSHHRVGASGRLRIRDAGRGYRRLAHRRNLHRPAGHDGRGLQLGYRLSLICAGAGALYIAEFVSWRSAYLAMAALMSVGLAAALVAPRVDLVPPPSGFPSVPPSSSRSPICFGARA